MAEPSTRAKWRALRSARVSTPKKCLTGATLSERRFIANNRIVSGSLTISAELFGEQWGHIRRLWNVWCEALGLHAIFRSVADRTGSDFLQRVVEKGKRCGANLTQVGRVLSALGFRGCSGPRDVCEGSVLHAGCQQCNVVGSAAYCTEGFECGAIGC